MDDTIRKFSDRKLRNLATSKKRLVRRPVILAVGQIRLWKDAGRLLHNNSDLAFTDFHDLTPELLDLIAPDVVLSPLVTRSFDCLDLSHLLYDSNFTGRYRIVSTAIAKPRIILSEISASCPGLDVSIIELSDQPNSGVH